MTRPELHWQPSPDYRTWQGPAVTLADGTLVHVDLIAYELIELAGRAARNKGGRSQAGPVRAVVVRRGR